MKIPRQRVEFTVKSLNFVKLLNKFNKEGLAVFDIRYKNDCVSFCAELNVKNKILAILEHSLYNEIETKTYSFGGFVKSKLFVIVGMILFLAISYIPHFVVYEVVVQCDDVVILDKIDNKLQEYKKANYILKKDIDLSEMKKQLFNIDGVSFCEATFKGGRLYVFVEAELVPEKQPANGQIRATTSGKITRISVTSGSAVVKVGDFVKKGDLLIDGKITIEGVDGEVKTDARGKVYCRKVFETREIVENDKIKFALEMMTQAHLVETRNSVVFDCNYEISEINGQTEIVMRSDFEKVISEE